MIISLIFTNSCILVVSVADLKAIPGTLVTVHTQSHLGNITGIFVGGGKKAEPRGNLCLQEENMHINSTQTARQTLIEPHDIKYAPTVEYYPTIIQT